MKRYIDAVVLLFTFVIIYAQAFDGELDDSFGTNGLVTFNIQSPATVDAAQALVVAYNGNIIAAGLCEDPNGLDGQGLALARLATDGSMLCASCLDPLEDDSFDQINGLAIQPDNKVIAVGSSNADGSVFVVARYNADCTLDTSFGTNGITRIQFPDANDARAYAVAFMRDGRIVVVGEAGQLMGNLFYAVAVLNQDGSLDNAFASGAGRRIYDTVVNNQSSSARAVAIQSIGDQDNILLAGYGNQDGRQQFQLLRITESGDLDSSFGSNMNGVEQINFDANNNEQAHGIDVRRDGRIVAAGTSTAVDTSEQIVIAQLLVDGTPDTTFGSSGQVVFSPTGQSVGGNAIVIQNDEKIVIAGRSVNIDTLAENVFLVRFTVNGLLDTATFNPSDGFVLTEFPDNSVAYALALQCDGKIVIAGINFAEPQQFALARYLNENGNQDVIVVPTITQPTNLSNVPASQPTFEGAAQNPANITVYIDGIEAARIITQGVSNSWEFTPPVPLDVGGHTVQVVAEYKSGNQNCISDPACYGICLGAQSCLSAAIRPKYCPSCIDVLIG